MPHNKNKVTLYLLTAFAIALILFQVEPSFATGGGLRKNSLKTCPNGVTYGMHSDGHGGTHWHVAVTNGNNYYASGDAIASDPCPGTTKNQGTAGATQGTTNTHSNSNSSSSNSPSGGNTSSNSGTTATTNNNPPKDTSSTMVPVAPLPSNDNSIKSIKIDGALIALSGTLSATVSKQKVDVNITPTDSKATVSFENRKLELGDNSFQFTVKAENGETKEYTLLIKRKSKEGEATLKTFRIGNRSANIDDADATISLVTGTTDLGFSYELSDPDALFKVYLGDKTIEDFNDYKEDIDYRLVVTDKDGNDKQYALRIKTITKAEDVALNLVGFTILFGMLGGCIFGVKKMTRWIKQSVLPKVTNALREKGLLAPKETIEIAPTNPTPKSNSRKTLGKGLNMAKLGQYIRRRTPHINNAFLPNLSAMITTKKKRTVSSKTITKKIVKMIEKSIRRFLK